MFRETTAQDTRASTNGIQVISFFQLKYSGTNTEWEDYFKLYSRFYTTHSKKGITFYI
jgi:hypothetical protein